MRGHVKRRCPKPAEGQAPCGKTCKHSWAYWLELDRGPDGKRRQVTKSGFATKKDADAALTKALSQVDDGTRVDPVAMTVGPYLGTWLQGLPRKPSTLVAYRRAVEHLTPLLGRHRLQALTSTHIKAAYRSLEIDTGLSTTTVQLCHQVLSKALSDAVDDRLLMLNPAATVKAPARAHVEMVTWNRQQASALLAAVADHRLAAMWRLFLTTGMRRGEVAALRWQDVDLERATLMVRQTGNTNGGEWITGTPKGRAGGPAKTRKLALDAGTVDALRRHRALQLQERLAWAGDWQDMGLVFVREDGRYLTPCTIGHSLTRWAKRLGLPHIRVHDLRHTYATLALEAGVHPKVVSERLGHANIGITLNLYSHVSEGMDRGAADLVAGLLS